MLAVCIIFATGNIHYNKLDASGNLKTWSKAERQAKSIIRIVLSNVRELH